MIVFIQVQLRICVRPGESQTHNLQIMDRAFPAPDVLDQNTIRDTWIIP